jgi:hypothetical protein
MDSGIVAPPVAQSSGTDRVAVATHAEKPARHAAIPISNSDLIVGMVIGIVAAVGLLTVGQLGVFLIAQVVL